MKSIRTAILLSLLVITPTMQLFSAATRNRTPLMTAALQGDAAKVKELINAGANLNLQDADGKTALELASTAQTRQLLDSASALTGAEVRNRQK